MDHQQLFTYLEADRLEYRERADDAAWDVRGWFGSDYHKLRWNTEGSAAPVRRTMRRWNCCTAVP